MQGINSTDERVLVALATIEQTLAKYYDISTTHDEGDNESSIPTMTLSQLKVIADDTRIDDLQTVQGIPTPLLKRYAPELVGESPSYRLSKLEDSGLITRGKMESKGYGITPTFSVLTESGWEEAERAARDVAGVGGVEVEEIAHRLDALEERLGVTSHPDEGVEDVVDVSMFDVNQNTVDEESPLLKRLLVLEGRVNRAEAKANVAYNALVSEGLVDEMEWRHWGAEKYSDDD